MIGAHGNDLAQLKRDHIEELRTVREVGGLSALAAYCDAVRRESDMPSLIVDLMRKS